MKFFIRFITGAITAWFIVMSVPYSYAQNEFVLVQRPDTEFLILGLESNGFSKSEGIDAYLPDDASTDHLLIPLEYMSRELGLAIESDPSNGTAEGFFISEEREFLLDMRLQQAISAGQTYPITDGEVELHAEDIFVQAATLEKWFDINITFDPNTLLLIVNSSEPFPFEKAADRQKNAERFLKGSRKPSFDPEQATLLDYGIYSHPYVNVQQGVLGIKTKDNNILQSTTNLQANMDLLKFGADLNLSYTADNQDKREFTSSRLTFSRSDPKKELLGPLKAGRIEVGDINFSDVPLVQGASSGAGVSISSDADFGFNLSQQTGQVTLDGEAPPDWDIELYRNGQFIDFRTVPPSGEFIFEEVQLISGFNRFQIIMFGPEGQERTLTRDIYSGPNQLAEGVIKYDLAAGRPQSDFLQVQRNARDDSRIGASAEVFYGVSDFLTLGGSLYKGPQGDRDVTAGSVSGSGAFGGFNLQLQLTRADHGRNAYLASIRKRFLGFNTALTHTKFDSFDPDDEDLLSSTEFALSRNFGKFNVSLIGETQNYQDDPDRHIIQNILSANLGGVRFTNDLTKTISDNDQIDDFEGELSVVTDIYDFRTRGSLLYDLDKDAQEKFKSVRLNGQKRFGKRDTIRVGGDYDFLSNVTSMDMRLSREFDPLAIDLDLGGNTENTYSVGLTLRTSLQPDSGKYKLIPPRLGTLATLGIRAFIDENDNKIFDEGESTLESIGFGSTRSQYKATTNESGVAWLNGLAETPTKIIVDQETIPSIYLSPAVKGLDLIPRRGSGSIVDFPFNQYGEIDGFVLTTDGSPISNIEVKAISIATGEEVGSTYTESDGYYIFNSLALGEYKVIASYAWFDEESNDTIARTVTLTVKEPSVINFDLELPPEELTIEPAAGFDRFTGDIFGPFQVSEKAEKPQGLYRILNIKNMP